MTLTSAVLIFYTLDNTQSNIQDLSLRDAAYTDLRIESGGWNDSFDLLNDK